MRALARNRKIDGLVGGSLFAGSLGPTPPGTRDLDPRLPFKPGLATVLHSALKFWNTKIAGKKVLTWCQNLLSLT